MNFGPSSTKVDEQNVHFVVERYNIYRGQPVRTLWRPGDELFPHFPMEVRVTPDRTLK